MAAVSSGMAGSEAGDAPSLREQVYEDLRYRLITGKISPSIAISTRGLAQQLGVSQTPVRDALSRLAAEGAVAIRSKRAVVVPPMTASRFAEITRCRLLLEPAAAADALEYIDNDALRAIRRADEAVDAALVQGDINSYMESNYRFHALIYGARPQPLINQLIDTLWMQFGPFMRIVYGRVGTANLLDQHVVATDAIAARDADQLARAIRDDIADGMALIREMALA